MVDVDGNTLNQALDVEVINVISAPILNPDGSSLNLGIKEFSAWRVADGQNLSEIKNNDLNDCRMYNRLTLLL